MHKLWDGFTHSDCQEAALRASISTVSFRTFPSRLHQNHLNRVVQRAKTVALSGSGFIHHFAKKQIEIDEGARTFTLCLLLAPCSKHCISNVCYEKQILILAAMNFFIKHLPPDTHSLYNDFSSLPNLKLGTELTIQKLTFIPNLSLSFLGSVLK